MNRILVKTKSVSNKKHYLYYHIRTDTNRVFYVGIGSNTRTNAYSRAINMCNRNEKWKDLAQTILEYKILILNDSDDYTEIKKLEIEHIQRLRNKNVGLTNIAAGGVGCIGYKHTLEHIESLKGNTRRRGIKHKQETIDYFKESRKGSWSNLYGKSGFKSYRSTPVAICDLDWNCLHQFGSTREAAKFLGVNKGGILGSIHKGYKCKGHRIRLLTHEEIQSVQFS